MSIPIVKRFLGENFRSPVNPKMALIRGNGGLDVRFYVHDPERHILGRNGVFWRILRQNPSRTLGCSELQEPPKKQQKLTRFWCAKSRMRGDETPERIVTNFCTGVGVHDVITSANFYDCRFWWLSVVGGQILGFSVDSRCRPYNTLALPCECVMCKAHSKVTYKTAKIFSSPQAPWI